MNSPDLFKKARLELLGLLTMNLSKEPVES